MRFLRGRLDACESTPNNALHAGVDTKKVIARRSELTLGRLYMTSRPAENFFSRSFVFGKGLRKKLRLTKVINYTNIIF